MVPGGGAAGIEGSIRSPSLTSSDDSWRKSATEKFTSARCVCLCVRACREGGGGVVGVKWCCGISGSEPTK